MLRPQPNVIPGFDPYNAFLGGPEPAPAALPDPYKGHYSEDARREAAANLACYETHLEVLS